MLIKKTQNTKRTIGDEEEEEGHPHFIDTLENRCSTFQHINNTVQ